MISVFQRRPTPFVHVRFTRSFGRPLAGENKTGRRSGRHNRRDRRGGRRLGSSFGHPKGGYRPVLNSRLIRCSPRLGRANIWMLAQRESAKLAAQTSNGPMV